VSKSKNIDLNHLKFRLKHINWLISSGKLSLLGRAIFENERKRILEEIRKLNLTMEVKG